MIPRPFWSNTGPTHPAVLSFRGAAGKDLEWSDTGVEGSSRFLNRVWRYAYGCLEEIQGVEPYDGSLEELGPELRAVFQKTHDTIRRVTDDIEERFHFNTAISAVMELVNALYSMEAERQVKGEGKEQPGGRKSFGSPWRASCPAFSIVPISPRKFGKPWRRFQRTVRQVARIPGRRAGQRRVDHCHPGERQLRGRFCVSADADDDTIRKMALEDEKARKFTEGKTIRKVVVVKKKLVNIVV